MTTFERIFRARIALHFAVLALVLVVCLVLIRPFATYTTDEGLAILQARQLERTGHWTYSVPDARLDPTGGATVAGPSDVGIKGRTYYAKHATYPLVLSVFDRAGGRTGLYISSLLGSLVAAYFTFLIARRLGLDDLEQRFALWLIALGSPLFIDTYEVLAHPLAVALSAVFVWLMLRGIQHRLSVAGVAGIFVAGALAALLRSEALFLGPAAVAALLVARTGTRRRNLFVMCIAAFAGSVAAYLIDRLMLHAIVGRAVTAVPLALSNGSWATDRVRGFLHTMLGAGDTGSWTDALPTLAAILFAFSAILPRTRYNPRLSPVCMVLGTFVLVVTAIFAPPTVVSGLLLTFPAGLLALLVWKRTDFVAHNRVLVVALASLAAAAIFLTQYAEGGGYEWGARYFAYLLPIWVPLAVVVLRRFSTGFAPGFLLGCLIVSIIAIDTLGLRGMRGVHALSDQIAKGASSAVAQTTAQHGTPIVIWGNSLYVQSVWGGVDTQHTLLANDREPKIGPSVDELVDRASRFASANAVVLITTESKDEAALQKRGYQVSRSRISGTTKTS